MKKDMLIEMTKVFFNQAQQANCYYSLIKQYAANKSSHYDSMAISPAYYHYTYNALIVATFMELSKLYDSHRQSANIIKFIDLCKENASYFPKFRAVKEMSVDGIERCELFYFQHTISDVDKDFFSEEVEANKIFYKSLNIEDQPIEVAMTIDRWFKLFEWRSKKINPQINNLLQQRNKIYAHNDQATLKISMDDVLTSYPLDHKDINDLIDFSLDYSHFVYAMLTGINKPKKPVNINDWANTLNSVEANENL